MFDELKGLKVLKGSRGRAPIDMRGFAQLVARLSCWSCSAPWLGELDINPIIADGAAFSIVDARIRLLPAHLR